MLGEQNSLYAVIYAMRAICYRNQMLLEVQLLYHRVLELFGVLNWASRQNKCAVRPYLHISLLLMPCVSK